MGITCNESQREAVSLRDGPCLVLAGPGSGKTYTITMRTKELIETHGIPPESILVITFTKNAAREMRQRFMDATHHRYPGCTFGTFHSVFFHILRQAYGYRPDQVLSEHEKYAWIKQILLAHVPKGQAEDDTIKALIGEITQMKNEYLAEEPFESHVLSQEDFGKICHAYGDALRRQGKIDYDDMLIYTYELLRDRKDILGQLQHKYRYLMVDEFQDINRLQYEITKLLAGETKNLFFVGDDDQSIYGFRGADPALMQEVCEDFPGIRKICLSVNYRCSKEVVTAAGNLIAQNEIRFVKDLVSARGEKGPVVYRPCRDLEEEIAYIMGDVRKHAAEGVPYHDMAVLYRVNTEAGRLSLKLREAGIPYVVKDAFANPYLHPVGQDLLAYGRIACGGNRREDYLRIMNRPVRYVKRAWFTREEVNLSEVAKEASETEWGPKAVARLQGECHMISKMSPYAAINYLRKALGYDAFLEEEMGKRHMNRELTFTLLDDLQDMSKGYKDFASWLAEAEETKDAIKSEQEATNIKDGMVLSTMHSAKGLEYKIVYILNCNEGSIPYHRAREDREIAEERRLFYVALTRAKDALHILWTKERYGKEVQPSRFIAEMRDSAPSQLEKTQDFGYNRKDF